LKRRAAIGLIAASQLLASTGGVSAQELTTIRVGASPSDGGTALLYAIDSGIFKKHGVDIQLQPAGSGAALASAVAGGTVSLSRPP